MGNTKQQRRSKRSASSAGSTPQSKQNSTDRTTNPRPTKKANVVSPGSIDLEQTSSLTVTQVRSNPMTFKILLLLIDAF